MIGAVHAFIGAGLGTICNTKSGAFLSGIVSHLAADMLPHNDYPPKVELPMVTGALALIGAWKGFDSKEFWGALGAIAPDIEHGLLVAGLIKQEQEIYPTHRGDLNLHGPVAEERFSQLLAMLSGIVVCAMGESDDDASL